jgi:mono/diheme cytochrome c family protein
MKRNTGWVLPVAILAGALTLGAADVSAQTALPSGVTQAMVDAGKTLYDGPALCSSCHGPAGAGTAIGPKFTDQVWLHSDGSYPAILNTIKVGVTTPKESMIPMLAKGGSGITDEQAAQVAAYVWRLSHP